MGQSGTISAPGSTVQCRQCEKYVDADRTFACRGCRKSPICRDHLDRELKLCHACATEERMRQLTEMQSQLRSITGFLRLMQFIFLVVSAFFVVHRLFSDYFPLYLRANVIFQYLYIWGGCAIAGMTAFYFMRSSQQKKVDELESQIRKRSASIRKGLF